MATGDSYLVALDGGGTKCRARLCDASGTELAAALGGSANLATDFEGARDNVLATIETLYRNAGLDIERRGRDAVFAGLAGCEAGGLARRLARQLGFGAAHVTSDREITVQGALGDDDGVVVLTGTGSFFVNRKGGIEQNVGGWGFVLGDEAGGAQLGRMALQRTLHAHDGLIEGSALTRAMLERFGGSPSGLVHFARRALPRDFGALAPDVVAAAERGDPVGGRILDDATAHINRVLERLGADSAPRICFLGGLGPVFEPRIAARYRPLCRPPRGTALDGAVALGRRAFADRLTQGT